MAQYRNINVRSPFYTQLATTEDSTTLELRIWEGDVSTDKPTDATYTLEKEQQGGQSTFEIAEIIRDFCSQTSTESSGAVWVETILDDSVATPTSVIYLASEGYSLYKDGVQHNGNSFETDFVALPSTVFTSEIRYVVDDAGSRIPVYVQPQNITDWKYRKYVNGVAGSWTVFVPKTQSSEQFQYIGVTANVTQVDFDFDGTTQTVIMDYLECTKYSSSSDARYNDRPIKLMYVNKAGARSYMTFGLKNIETINVSDTTFNRNVMDVSTLSNGAGLHASRRKITGSKQSFVINTDWLNEYHVNQLEELIMSEYVWAQIFKVGSVNYLPVNLKTSNLEKKNHLNDKLIQYTFEIESASEYINTVR